MVEAAVDQPQTLRKSRSGRVLDTDQLSSVFGVDIDTEEASSEDESKPARRARRSARAGTKATSGGSDKKTATKPAARKSVAGKSAGKAGAGKSASGKGASAPKGRVAGKAASRKTSKVKPPGTKAAKKGKGGTK